MYLLDTDTSSFIFSERSVRASQRFSRSRSEDLSISSITLGELQYGVERSRNARYAALLRYFLDTVQVVPYGALAAYQFARVKAELAQRGELIGPYDLQIAAHAIALGATLVTHNTREFSRIEGLELDDWVTDAY